jgi:hypothetical protein
MRANLESLLAGQPLEFGAADAMVEAVLAEWATSRGTAP